MPKKRILFVFGTRPEAIKLAPVIEAFNQDKNGFFEILICSTGQHREMLEQAVSKFRIPVHQNLSIMTENQTLTDIETKTISKITPLYKTNTPDLVMVQGDTTTAMAAAKAAFGSKIKVAHVEAGLRSFDRKNPYPEEDNRVEIDRVSSLHFAPTALAKENLLKEGVPAKSVVVTGNTVIDALRFIVDQTKTESEKMETLPKDKKWILVTAHRRENFGKPLENICKAILKIVKKYKEKYHIVYPVHLNPNVKETVFGYLANKDAISLWPPCGYNTLIKLLGDPNLRLILTDSGGIQEEAPAFGKPVIVLRKVTERPEAIKAGCARLVGELTEDNIFSSVDRLLSDPNQYQKMARVANPFGDGKASQRILEATKKFFDLPAKNLPEFKG
ncbi:MAG: UDP-N-acetylglucosamine 2-epimerase (non-hydrolyzing) [Elusimicrobia bacterium]|nr:UDP-N-acetylglucosamine 2-epimerase (non-hydrolyzing) [Elusimicrobiota bacterium]